MKTTYFNQMKSIGRILFFMLFFGMLWSCEESLMEVPQSSLSPEIFYSTGKEAVASVNACYQSMKDNFISTDNGVNIYLDVLNDFNFVNVKQWDGFTTNSLSSNNGRVIDSWKRFYATIGAANITIGRLENTDIADEIKKRVIGEAKFLRALNYFYVVQFWGPVPLKTTLPKEADDMNLVRSSIQEIYDVIITDLQFAEENCWNVGETRIVETDSYTNDKGRATKGAAKALLAKVYLKIASTSSAAKRRTDAPLVNVKTGQVDGLEAYKSFDANKFYDLCITKCNEVEALGYSLNAEFMKNFTTKNGVESLFEIQAFGQLGYGSRLAPVYCPPQSGLYGGTTGGQNGLTNTFMLKGPFKIFKIANYNYRPAVAGDPAKSITNSPIDITDLRYKNGFIFGYTNRINNQIFNYDLGTGQYISNTNVKLPRFYTAKYIDKEGTIQDDNSNNWVLLRFADVLLMKAECLFEKGDLNASWDLIKRVHTRDGKQNKEAGNLFPETYAGWISYFSGANDVEKFREAIMHERFIELVYEGHRFLDLCRMGKLEEKCAAVGRTKSRKSYYMPISQIEINANMAISSADDNPGYETVAK